MRLSKTERDCIRSGVKKIDPLATVYLYGSRVDDLKRGGDIDLLVISDHISLSQKIDLLVQIKNEIGDQKIDLKILKDSEKDSDVFFETVKNQIEEI